MAREVANHIFVGELSWECTKQQFDNAFGHYGKILAVEMYPLVGVPVS